jgi:hypothetical protein
MALRDDTESDAHRDQPQPVAPVPVVTTIPDELWRSPPCGPRTGGGSWGGDDGGGGGGFGGGGDSGGSGGGGGAF